ncbi:MAG: succinate dehydrogenase cytochrome b subunit [Desulfatibacillum sp.]|nr:succinate dehydrogenase cytochrome b subunit [Desulfatibacillum sp.]
MMALTGLGFIGFIAGHLAGNLTLYAGGAAFNGYAAHLHSLGPLVTAAEFGLLSMAAVHVSCGLWLFLQNLAARPNRYAVNRRAGGRTIGSATMPYTGVLIAAFVVFHLLNFHFVDKSHTTIFTIVAAAFSSPLVVALYIAAMVVVAVHVSHGLWSAFQTLGASHPKYMPAIMALSVAFAVAVGVGFGFLPIYVSMAV